MISGNELIGCAHIVLIVPTRGTRISQSVYNLNVERCSILMAGLGLLTDGSDGHPDWMGYLSGSIRIAVGWTDHPSGSNPDGWIHHPDRNSCFVLFADKEPKLPKRIETRGFLKLLCYWTVLPINDIILVKL